MPYRVAISAGPSAIARLVLSWIPGGQAFNYDEREEPGGALDPLLVRGAILETPLPDGYALPGGYGREGRSSIFSRHARRVLIEAGAALDESAPRDECLFITLTHPGSTNESFKALAEWSGYIVHRFKSWIAKKVPSKLDFYTWEWQKRGALHLHYCVHCPSLEAFKEIQASVKKEWIRLIDSVCERSGVDLWGRGSGGSWSGYKSVVRVEAARVKKSVASYLAKYLSKASKIGVDGEGRRFFPSRWYGVSRGLRDKIRDLSVSLIVGASWSYRAARLQYDDIFQELGLWADRVYEYKCGPTQGLSAVALVPREDGRRLRCFISNLVVPMTSSSGDRNERLCRIASAMLRASQDQPLWLNLFCATASQHVRKVLTAISNCESQSANDLEMVVDSLALALRRTCRTMGYATLQQSRFLQEASYLVPEGNYWPLWKEASESPVMTTSSDETAEDELPLTPLQLIIGDCVPYPDPDLPPVSGVDSRDSYWNQGIY